MAASPNPSRLELAFDIGHSSIGWSVLAAPDAASPSLIGCGSVIFEKDSALANTRRLHRSQRRHVRATRQRIARMEKLLVHLGIFTPAELAAKHRANGGSPTPWLLAARVLASDGAQTLTWPELWDVLRWYAHNRGYEEITGETRDDDEESDEKKQDTEKVENAKKALAQFGKNSMAETICAWLGQDPLGPRTGTTENYKAKNCAFERAFVDAEVTRLLASHLGKLPGVTEALVAALILDARAIAVPSIRLPLRYQGSLLFGRLATRYHNRIIGACPISGEKIPGKNCPEFLRYRWAMQLANLRVANSADAPLRPLTVAERVAIHTLMVASGSLGVRDLKDAVRALAGHARDNLEQFFLHPDAKEGLVLDPVQKLIAGDTTVSAVWPHLPERLQKRTRGRWRRGKSTTLAKLRDEAAKLGHNCTAFDAAVDALCAPPKKPSKKTPPPVKEKLLLEPLDARRELAKLSGRAPYSRPLLAQAFDEVMAGRDPKATDGCLEETEAVRHRRESRPLPQQTNNHLVRHRLQIFGRLLADLIADPAYGANDPARISRVTLEVNRDLREMSGLSAQDLAKELGKRLADHKRVSAYLEEKLPPGTPISAGLIRKARIAHDLGWQCPYTGAQFEPMDLITRRVDKDHIIPHALRKSDSLDSLVVTFSAVNAMKRKRTALQFVTDEAGKSVPSLPNLSIMTPDRFEKLARAHAPKGDPRKLARARGERVNDDDLRCWRRMLMMTTKDYEEKGGGFTPGQLTQTSQLARLAAQVVREPFAKLPDQPQLVAMPGSVTGAIRKAWKVLACLSAAAPGVMENITQPDGTTKPEVKTKTEIRDITHLHHALDASVLALAAHFIPNRGDVWRLLAERRLNPAQQAELAALGLFDFDERGQFRLRDLGPGLKAQLRERLAERRVVQHVPADMSGLRAKQNTRGILDDSDPITLILKPSIGDDGAKQTKPEKVLRSKVIGLPRVDGTGGKLAALKGVRVIDGNFGVAVLDNPALLPADRFVIIPHARVARQIYGDPSDPSVSCLKKLNGGKVPTIWRNGQIITLSIGERAGRWRIFSIKNSTAKGLVVDLGSEEEIYPSWLEVRIRSLVRDGARRVAATLTGTKRPNA